MFVQIARVDKKYLGDPESPNFLPDSPLIDRPVLSSKLENELKFVCRLVLTNVQSSDDNDADPLSGIIHSLQGPQDLPAQDAPRQKAPIPARPGPKPATRSRYHLVARTDVRARHEREAAGTIDLPSKPTLTESPTAQPVSAQSNEEALSAIRSLMGSRPKTSAAACIDFTGESTDPSSLPSNRTTYTTYSTPATSTGYATTGRKKSYTQDEPAMPEMDLYGLLSQGDSPAGDSAQVHAWMDQQYEHRRLHGSNGFDYPVRVVREFHPAPPPEEPEHMRRQGKPNSIRSNIQEYFRPGSAASNVHRRNSFTSNIRNYIRPGSSAGSIQSVASNSSTLSRTQEHWSTIKRKLSNASRMSQRSNRQGTDGAERYQKPSGETEVDLNRPLPPLPGLDSYKEKKPHIASFMKKVPTSKFSSNAAVDNTSPDHPTTTQRDSSHSMPSNFQNMSTSSIGSTPTRVNAPNLERPPSRPHAARSGTSLGVSPLSQSTIPKTESKKEGFAKRWGGKFALGKKPKAVVAA